MKDLIFLFLYSFFSCLVLSFILLKIHSKTDFFNKLNLSVEKKSKNIPFLGGLSLAGCFFILLSYIIFYSDLGFNLNKLYAFLIGGAVIFFVGILDDIYEFSPIPKLLGQIIAASIAVSFGVHTNIIYISSEMNIFITIIWIVTIINAFNFLDIMDGLAAGVSIISSLAFLIFGIYTGNFLVTLISLSLIGMLFGFLVFNFPPAKIYLGDSGSMFLGYILSITAINISYATRGYEFALISPILVLGFPLYDISFVTFRRFLRKKSIVKKSDDHLVFQLVRKGFSEKASLFLMYLLCILFSIVAIALTQFKNEISIFIFLSFLILFILINIFLLKNKYEFFI